MLSPETLALYLCTGPVATAGVSLCEAVEQAIAGGVTVVQLRLKNASTRDFYETGQRLHALLRERRVPLVVNDRLDLALALEAEGAHIGQSDMPLPIARRLLRGGRQPFVGVSVATVKQALEAEADGADYLGAGPLFPTSSKSDAGKTIGLAGLKAITQSVQIPVVGIGGITIENAPEVWDAGAAGLAVISAILSANNITVAACRLLATKPPTAKMGRQKAPLRLVDSELKEAVN